jgi:hypothetical protein
MPPDITAVAPSQLLAGQTTQVIVDGVNLPPTANGYAVLRSDGQVAQGVSVQLTSPGARSAILQITVSVSTPSGPYQLRAQNMVGFDTAPLDILAGISKVELSASPSAQSISPGQSASYTINLTRTNFTGAVALAVSGLPSGATAMFSPNPAPGTSSILTIITPATTTTGTRTLTISGAAPGVTVAATTVSLTVSSGALITGFTPTSGPEGTDVDISGPNLAGATGVQFGSVSAPEFTVNASGAITAEVPEGAPQNAVVSVILLGGLRVTSTDSFAVTAATNTPRINKFMPPSGKLPDTNPTVMTTRIDLMVPMGAITGPVKVITPQPPPAMFPTPFTVIPAGPKPEITRFAPLDGVEGAQVELAGKNFTGVTAVMFGGVSAPFVINPVGVNALESITAYVPIRLNVGDADRRVTISVSAAAGSASASGFTVLAPKTVGTSFFITLPQGTIPPKAKESKEGKDTKEKEFKEKESDGKDFRKDFKDTREGKDLFEFSSVGMVEPIERLARLEGAVGQLMHFISPALRPDLNAGVLTGEPERSSDERAAVSQFLQQQASAAKQAKDSKDVEKLRER